MRVYRVTNTKYGNISESGLLENHILMPPKIFLNNYSNHLTTFAKDEILDGKYFFVDFLDAVKFAIFETNFNTNKITSLDIPDELINPENIGYGYYRETGNLLNQEKYYAIELLLQYEKLYNCLSKNKEKSLYDEEGGYYNYIDIKPEVQIDQFSKESLVVQKAIQILELYGATPYYEEGLEKMRKIHGYYKQNFELTSEQREEKYKIFLEYSKCFIKDHQLDSHLKKIKALK